MFHQNWRPQGACGRVVTAASCSRRILRRAVGGQAAACERAGLARARGEGAARVLRGAHGKRVRSVCCARSVRALALGGGRTGDACARRQLRSAQRAAHGRRMHTHTHTLGRWRWSARRSGGAYRRRAACGRRAGRSLCACGAAATCMGGASARRAALRLQACAVFSRWCGRRAGGAHVRVGRGGRMGFACTCAARWRRDREARAPVVESGLQCLTRGVHSGEYRVCRPPVPMQLANGSLRGLCPEIPTAEPAWPHRHSDSPTEEHRAGTDDRRSHAAAHIWADFMPC